MKMFNLNLKSFLIILFYFILINFNLSESESYSEKKVVLRRTSNTCLRHTDCPANSYCDILPTSTNSGFCICTDGYMLIDYYNRTKECLRVATTLNDPCEYDDQCKYTLSTDAECRFGICQCRESSHYVKRENKCYKSVRLGEYCRYTNNCLGNGTVCRDGRCECPINTHPNYEMTTCLNDIDLGEECNTDEECITENSRCHNVCRCSVSHILSKSSDQCLKIADRLGDTCIESEQCTINIANTICHLGDDFYGNCSCRSGYHEINQKCWLTVKLNDYCESNENCILNDFSICRNGRCGCEESFREFHGKCTNSSNKKLSFSLINFLGILVILKITEKLIFK